jgi:hypothetical protein
VLAYDTDVPDGRQMLIRIAGPQHPGAGAYYRITDVERDKPLSITITAAPSSEAIFTPPPPPEDP